MHVIPGTRTAAAAAVRGRPAPPVLPGYESALLQAARHGVEGRARVAGRSKSGGPLGAIREFGDRVVASDPGLVRARMAISAAVAMSVALAVEFGYAEAIHDGSEGILIAMMLGGVVAMMGSMALVGTAPWPKLRTGVFFPVAFGAGMLPGALVAGHTDLMLTVFVAVMFVAVFVRRFGPAFFFYGFMLWMGYFFAAFLGANLGQAAHAAGRRARRHGCLAAAVGHGAAHASRGGRCAACRRRSTPGPERSRAPARICWRAAATRDAPRGRVGVCTRAACGCPRPR